MYQVKPPTMDNSSYMSKLAQPWANCKRFAQAAVDIRVPMRNFISHTTVCIGLPTKKFGERLLWRHNGRDGVSNHQPHDCLLNRSFGRRSKNISQLCVTGLCVGNSPVTSGFSAQIASNAENVSIWWRHHDDRSLGRLVRRVPYK